MLAGRAKVCGTGVFCVRFSVFPRVRVTVSFNVPAGVKHRCQVISLQVLLVCDGCLLAGTDTREEQTREQEQTRRQGQGRCWRFATGLPVPHIRTVRRQNLSNTAGASSPAATPRMSPHRRTHMRETSWLRNT